MEITIWLFASENNQMQSTSTGELIDNHQDILEKENITQSLPRTKLAPLGYEANNFEIFSFHFLSTVTLRLIFFF